MSDAAIFAIGSLVFIATSWATVAFGIKRFHDLEVESSGVVVETRPGGLTETHGDEASD